jgi:uncharacterized membrane protein
MAGAKTDHTLERLVFFSDAVFAIAITLLVIEIHPPHLPHGAGNAQHLQALAGLIPQFVGYFISFWVIGAFWMGHHRAFGLAAHYSPRILVWNMALLNVIAFMPFVSAYLSSNQAQAVPTVAYCLMMTIAALLNYKVNKTATSAPMVDEEADPEAVRLVRQRSISVVLGALSAVAFSCFVPQFGQLGLTTIPLWRRALARWPKPPREIVP